jgi:polyferredoxin
VFRPRVVVYTSILALVLAGLLVAMALRAPFKVNVVRDRGALARIVDDGYVENVYRLQVMNATESRQSYRFGATGMDGIATSEVGRITVEPAQALWVPLALRVPPQSAAAAGPGSHPVQFVIELADQAPDASPVRLVEKSTFVVPR